MYNNVSPPADLLQQFSPQPHSTGISSTDNQTMTHQQPYHQHAAYLQHQQFANGQQDTGNAATVAAAIQENYFHQQHQQQQQQHLHMQHQQNFQQHPRQDFLTNSMDSLPSAPAPAAAIASAVASYQQQHQQHANSQYPGVYQQHQHPNQQRQHYTHYQQYHQELQQHYQQIHLHQQQQQQLLQQQQQIHEQQEQLKQQQHFNASPINSFQSSQNHLTEQQVAAAQEKLEPTQTDQVDSDQPLEQQQLQQQELQNQEHQQQLLQQKHQHQSQRQQDPLCRNEMLISEPRIDRCSDAEQLRGSSNSSENSQDNSMLVSQTIHEVNQSLMANLTDENKLADDKIKCSQVNSNAKTQYSGPDREHQNTENSKAGIIIDKLDSPINMECEPNSNTNTESKSENCLNFEATNSELSSSKAADGGSPFETINISKTLYECPNKASSDTSHSIIDQIVKASCDPKYQIELQECGTDTSVTISNTEPIKEPFINQNENSTCKNDSNLVKVINDYPNISNTINDEVATQSESTFNNSFPRSNINVRNCESKMDFPGGQYDEGHISYDCHRESPYQTDEDENSDENLRHDSGMEEDESIVHPDDSHIRLKLLDTADLLAREVGNTAPRVNAARHNIDAEKRRYENRSIYLNNHDDGNQYRMSKDRNNYLIEHSEHMNLSCEDNHQRSFPFFSDQEVDIFNTSGLANAANLLASAINKMNPMIAQHENNAPRVDGSIQESLIRAFNVINSTIVNATAKLPSCVPNINKKPGVNRHDELVHFKLGTNIVPLPRAPVKKPANVAIKNSTNEKRTTIQTLSERYRQEFANAQAPNQKLISEKENITHSKNQPISVGISPSFSENMKNPDLQANFDSRLSKTGFLTQNLHPSVASAISAAAAVAHAANIQNLLARDHQMHQQNVALEMIRLAPNQGLLNQVLDPRLNQTLQQQLNSHFILSMKNKGIPSNSSRLFESSNFDDLNDDDHGPPQNLVSGHQRSIRPNQFNESCQISANCAISHLSNLTNSNFTSKLRNGNHLEMSEEQLSQGDSVRSKEHTTVGELLKKRNEQLKHMHGELFNIMVVCVYIITAIFVFHFKCHMLKFFSINLLIYVNLNLLFFLPTRVDHIKKTESTR